MENKRNKIILIVTAIVLFVFAVWFFIDTLSEGNKNTLKTVPIEEIETKEKVKNFLDFSVYNSNNEEVTLYSFRGKPILVYFWSETNQDSINQLKMVQDLYNIYKDDVNFVVVTMFDGEYASIKSVEKILFENEITMPNYYDLDSNAKNTYMLTKAPVTMLIDRNEKLVNTNEGILDADALSASVEILVEDFENVTENTVENNM